MKELRKEVVKLILTGISIIGGIAFLVLILKAICSFIG